MSTAVTALVGNPCAADRPAGHYRQAEHSAARCARLRGGPGAHGRRRRRAIPGTPTNDAGGIAGETPEWAEVVDRGAIARK
jgi:hypothetical protein